MNRKKKLSEVVKLYGRCIQEPIFVGNRPSSTFWKLRAFFNKQDDSRLDNIYLYLKSLDVYPVMNITTLIQNADKFNMESKWENDTKEKVEVIEDAYSIDDFLSL